MRMALLGLALLVADVAAAVCTTQTLTTADGRFLVCTTCCDSSGNCNTTCY